MKQYKNKRSKAVGTVVIDGITPLLRFEDGSEEILTPAILKKDWELIEDETPERLTYGEFYTLMCQWNRQHNDERATKFGVMVFSQSNFKNTYSETSRSYRVDNANPVFRRGTRSDELIGDCLDGTDSNVRLDFYNWDVEYCYFE